MTASGGRRGAAAPQCTVLDWARGQEAQAERLSLASPPSSAPGLTGESAPAQGYVSAFNDQVPTGNYTVSNQVVLATEDGGLSWRTIFQGAVPIRAIQFFDEQHGLLGGGHGPLPGGAHQPDSLRDGRWRPDLA